MTLLRRTMPMSCDKLQMVKRKRFGLQNARATWGCGYPSRERVLTELTLDPPDATSDQAGVPLLDEVPDPVDHPLAQGPGMEVSIRAECRRRVHAIGFRSRHL